jgi:hypothetical protein
MSIFFIEKKKVNVNFLTHMHEEKVLTSTSQIKHLKNIYIYIMKIYIHHKLMGWNEATGS